MQDVVRLGRISTIDYARGLASVIYPDRNDEPSPEFPFFSMAYEMPKTDDLVVVLLVPNSTMKGVILGIPWGSSNVPSWGGKGIFHKQFSDGAYVRYNSSTKEMEVSAETVKIKHLMIEKLEVSGTAQIPHLETNIEEASQEKEW